jgi:RND superfamily putative drug exporter
MTLVPALMTLLGRAAWWMPRWLGRMLPNMDIEGEDLRQHRAAVLWSQDRAGSVISTQDLVVGSGEGGSAPVSVDIPAGALVLVAGSRADRRAFIWTLAGRLLPVAGRAQVGGHPLPSESERVARIVAVVETGGLAGTGTPVTVGDLLDSRLRITQPWYRLARRAVVRRWIARLADALGGGSVTLDAGTELAHLAPLERAITLAVVAMAERPRVLMIEQADGASELLSAEFLGAVCALAPAGTTVVVATNAAVLGLDIDRPLITVDLDGAGSEPDRPTHQSLLEGSRP